MIRFATCLALTLCLTLTQPGCSHDNDTAAENQDHPNLGPQEGQGAEEGPVTKVCETGIPDPQGLWSERVGTWKGSTTAYDFQKDAWTLTATVIITGDGTFGITVTSSPVNVDLERSGSCEGSWLDADSWNACACGFDDAIDFITDTEAVYLHYSTQYGGDWDNIKDSVPIPLIKQ